MLMLGSVWFQKLSIPPPRKRFFLRPPPPPLPQEFSIPSVAGVWLFSGTTQFWSQLNESWMGTGYTFTIFHSTSVIVIIALHSKI